MTQVIDPSSGAAGEGEEFSAGVIVYLSNDPVPSQQRDGVLGPSGFGSRPPEGPTVHNDGGGLFHLSGTCRLAELEEQSAQFARSAAKFAKDASGAVAGKASGPELSDGTLSRPSDWAIHLVLVEQSLDCISALDDRLDGISSQVWAALEELWINDDLDLWSVNRLSVEFPAGWHPFEGGESMQIRATTESLGQLRLWHVVTQNPIWNVSGSEPAAPGQLSVTDQLITDPYGAPTPLQSYVRWLSRQRHHARAAEVHDGRSSEIWKRLEIEGRAVSLATLQETGAEQALHAASAQRCLTELRVNTVNVRRYREALAEQFEVPPSKGLFASDALFEEARVATMRGIAERTSLQAQQLQIERDSRQRVEQTAATRSSSLATLFLTVVAGSGTFVQLSTDNDIRAGILLITAPLLAALGYLVTHRDSKDENWVPAAVGATAGLSIAGFVTIAAAGSDQSLRVFAVTAIANAVMFWLWSCYKDGEPCQFRARRRNADEGSDTTEPM